MFIPLHRNHGEYMELHHFESDRKLYLIYLYICTYVCIYSQTAAILGRLLMSPSPQRVGNFMKSRVIYNYTFTQPLNYVS